MHHRRSHHHHTEEQTWHVPYCNACLGHLRAWNGIIPAPVVLLIAVSLGFVFGYSAGLGWGAMVGAVAMIGFAFVRRSSKGKVPARCGATCACVDCAVVYEGWDRTVHRFAFASDFYAAAFIAMNRRKLVNMHPAVLDQLAARPPSPGRATPIAKPFRDDLENDVLLIVGGLAVVGFGAVGIFGGPPAPSQVAASPAMQPVLVDAGTEADKPASDAAAQAQSAPPNRHGTRAAHAPAPYRPPAPAYRSGPHCVRGCPCGNSCIPCSHRCYH
jgi:hypothetical protein